MNEPNPTHTDSVANSPRLRWWPAALILGAAAVAIAVIRVDGSKTFQQRNLTTLSAGAITLGVLLLWWLFLSRIRWRQRFLGVAVLIAVLGGAAALFRIRGVSGDLVPIFEPRWSKNVTPPAAMGAVTVAPANPKSDLSPKSESEFPQFLGPARNGILPNRIPRWNTHWDAASPQVVWKRPIGAAWSGWIISGDRAWTQEQSGPLEKVTCYELASGRLIWEHTDETRYATTIAGEGPRATPTLAGNRIFTLGGSGLLNCLDRASGQRIWSKDLIRDTSASAPEWGFSGSPLIHDGLVIVIAGGRDNHSLVAFDQATGELRWSGGDHGASYSSPTFATLAGIPQILAFNSRHITAHDPSNGSVLWDHAFGNGQPHVAMPAVIGRDQVFISAGYGVGAELLQVTSAVPGKAAVTSLWASKKMKAKFSNPVVLDGFVYGLDDGILACVDLKDGTLRWKEGRYGHGQGLLTGDLYLLMSETGDLVLLQPTPAGPGVLGTFHVLDGKTWNPIAVVDNLVLTRNDQEAALVRLPTVGKP